MSDDKPRNLGGRPPLPPEKRRTGRLSIRVLPEIEEKARLLGTEGVEAAIRRAKVPRNPAGETKE